MREVEPADVVHGFILPQLARAADRMQQQQQQAGDTSASEAGAADTAAALPHVQLSKQEQLHLMRLLAFPLAARLLDSELGAASQGMHHNRQQQQQLDGQLQGHKAWDSYQAGGSSSTAAAASGAEQAAPGLGGGSAGKAGSLMSQLAHVAVLVSSTGHAVLAPSCAAKAAAAAAADAQDDGELYLPKQLSNSLDLTQLFPAHRWQLVSPDYASCCSGVDPQQWSLLMQALGVQTFLPVRQQTVELTWKQLMVGGAHAAWRTAVERMDDSVRYVFSDWQWSSLQRLLDSIAGDADVVRRTQQYRSLSSVVAGLWQGLQASGQLQCSYSLRTGVPATSAAANGGGAKSSQAGADGADSAVDPQQQRRRKKAAACTDTGAGSKPGLSAGAASWQPGRQSLKLPSSVLLGLQSWPWMLASDGKAHPPTDLFARQQVREKGL